MYLDFDLLFQSINILLFTTVCVAMAKKKKSKHRKEKKKVVSSIEDNTDEHNQIKLPTVNTSINDGTPQTDLKVKRPPKRIKIKGVKKNKEKRRHTKNEPLLKENALTYLRQWKQNRQLWKFEKLKQIWLLQNAFDDEKVPSDIYPVFIDYISSANGKVKDVIIEKSAKVIEAMEKRMTLLEQGLNNQELNDKYPELEISDEVYQRARSLVQAL